MRIYIAGGSDERTTVKALMRDAIERGHEVTHDWTSCEGYDRVSTEAERRRWAKLDVSGVSTADAVWLVAPKSKSEGSACELGVALALGKRVVISGAGARDTGRIFYLLAEVYDSHQEALRALGAT